MDNNRSAVEFLCRVLTPFYSSDDTAYISHKITQSGVDWVAVVWIANSNLLTPSLYYSLKKRGILKIIDDNQLEGFLKEVYLKNRERNENIRGQLLDIQQILKPVNIFPLFLKGASIISERLYCDIGVRAMTDVDIMIDPQYFKIALEELKRGGYEEFGRDLGRWHHHSPRMNKTGFPAALEPHFRIILDKKIEYIPYNETTSMNSSDKEFEFSKVLKPTWHLYHAFLHTAVVDKNHRQWRLGLRHLYDFVMLAKGYGDRVDWQELYALARKYEHEKILEDYLYMAYKLFNLETPLGFNRARGWLHLKKVMWQMGLVPGTKVHNLYRAYTEFGEIYSYEALKNFYGLHSKSQYPAAFVRYIFYHMRKHLF